MTRKYHNHKLQTTRGTARKSRSTITRHQEDVLLDLILVQTVCKGYQQMAKVATSWQRIKCRTISWYSFLAKTLAKVNFIWLKLFSIWLKCWLQQIQSQGRPCGPLHSKVTLTFYWFTQLCQKRIVPVAACGIYNIVLFDDWLMVCIFRI